MCIRDRSTADFVLLLNPDARITPDNVLLLARALAEEPRLGAVAPEIFWNEQHSFVLPPAFPQTPWYSMAMALATYSRDATRWTAHLGLSKALLSPRCAVHRVASREYVASAIAMLYQGVCGKAGGRTNECCSFQKISGATAPRRGSSASARASSSTLSGVIRASGFSNRTKSAVDLSLIHI